MPATAETIIALFDRTLTRIFGQRYAREVPNKTDMATASQWLEIGCDEYIATIVFWDRMSMMHERHLRAHDERDRQNVPGALKVFTDNIESALRSNGGGGVDMWELAQAQWVARLSGYKKNPKLWCTEMWGPPPGQPGCRVPKRLL